LAYSRMEAQGLFLPVVEANCRYIRRVRFDDGIVLRTRLSDVGRASIRFDYQAVLDGPAGDAEVVAGWTTHAFVDAKGQIVRPPGEVVRVLRGLVREDASGQPGA
jgi:acyl-CoA thioester hydrolase